METRKEKMLRMRFENFMTLREIGEEFGISKMRVNQIIGNTGRINVVKRNKEISQSTKTNTELAERYGVTKATISTLRTNHHDIDGGCVQMGEEAERFVSDMLSEKGISNKLTPIAHPFDILAFGKARIDVKSAHTRRKAYPTEVSPQWRFGLKINDRGKYCDIFVCVIWKTKDCFIIPFEKISEKLSVNSDLTFCYPTKRPEIGKWQKYHNRWDLIRA
jgi:DNA-binding Xre family transcriptional regulator